MAVRTGRTGRTARASGRVRVAGTVRAGSPPYPRFALFAECLLTGVWLLVAALPLVTLLPAFAAACAHLRRHLAGERSGLREFTADLRRAVRTGWRWSLAWWAGLVLLAFDVRVAASGLLPGGRAMAVVGAAALVLLIVTGLRAAAAPPPSGPVSSAPPPSGSVPLDPSSSGPASTDPPSSGRASSGRAAACPEPAAAAPSGPEPALWPPVREVLHRAAAADPGGSALLAGGLAVVAVAAWQLLPLAAPALGCLAACAVAVEHRHAERQRAAGVP